MADSGHGVVAGVIRVDDSSTGTSPDRTAALQVDATGRPCCAASRRSARALPIWPVSAAMAARHTLGHRPDDTDALNFLGIAARADGDLERARAFWDTSVVGGDAVAPLLIKIAFPGED
jgi:hypothetical protein